MPAINAERLLKDLHDLRKIGAVGVGVVRPAFSTSDMEAREWLRHRFIEAGLESSIDGIGNVLGKSKNAGPAILIGSHSDTQPEGGWLDGALGVIYALEIARACAENKQTHDLAIDTMAWQEEEGAFKPLLGSSSFFGMHTSDDEVGLVNNEGTLLVDAIKTAGLDGIPRHVMEKDRYVGYLEGHIEQGPYLDIANEHIRADI